MSMHPTFENQKIRKALVALYEAWREANKALDHDIAKGGFTEKDAPGMFLDNLEDGIVDRDIWEQYMLAGTSHREG